MNFSEIDLISKYSFKNCENIGNLLVDVGAHEGGVTAKFSKMGWRVIAFEPENNNRKEFEINHYNNSNVICIPKAVTDKSGDRIPFYISEKHFGIHTIRPFHQTHKVAEYEVETITLKDILEELNINHVSFLKIDIEGADYLALKGFDWNRISPEIIMVEFMDDRSNKNFSYTHHDMVRYMDNKGYRCFISEWKPVIEYGIKGKIGQQHEWIQCVPYPLKTNPNWGNLIFVPKNDKIRFEKTLKSYKTELQNQHTRLYRKSGLLKFKIFLKKTFFR